MQQGSDDVWVGATCQLMRLVGLHVLGMVVEEVVCETVVVGAEELLLHLGLGLRGQSLVVILELMKLLWGIEETLVWTLFVSCLVEGLVLVCAFWLG